MECFYWVIFSTFNCWNCFVFFACLLILGGLKVKINILIIKNTCKALVSQTLIKNGYKIVRNKNQN